MAGAVLALHVHFSSDTDHKPVVLLGLERERPDGIVWGGAVFGNSFGQPSAYAFGGQRLYRWSRWEPLYAEWSAGLLYGYTGEYKNKVPLNYKGFSPGHHVGLGWQFTPAFAGQVNLLGNSGADVLVLVRACRERAAPIRRRRGEARRHRAESRHDRPLARPPHRRDSRRATRPTPTRPRPPSGARRSTR